MNKEKYPCPCCGFFTFVEMTPGCFEICPVCFWQDDPVQYKDENYVGGANKTSLKQAKRNFLAFGAMEQRFISFVRPPLENEIP